LNRHTLNTRLSTFRFLFSICLPALTVLLVVLPLTNAIAQEPVATQDPAAPIIQPTVSLPGDQAPVVPPADQPPADQVPVEPVPTEDTGIEPPPLPPVDATITLLTNIRADIDLLANTLLAGQFPTGWNGTLDVNNPQLPIIIRLDLELLTGTLLGADQRPAGWFGAVPSTPFAIARDIRHDLELLADQVVQPGVRPPGWLGADPLMRCGRAVQALVNLLQLNGVFQLQADPNSADFCQQAEQQVTQFAEVNLLTSASPGGRLLAPSGPASVNTDFAVAFLDTAAQLRVGIIPNGTSITPVARSFGQFSKMMLVSGDNFQVYVDFQFTSVTPEQFDALPDVTTVDNSPQCGADWCLAG
jgi:hypothetical protein